jgi:hypothetical protein
MKTLITKIVNLEINPDKVGLGLVAFALSGWFISFILFLIFG